MFEIQMFKKMSLSFYENLFNMNACERNFCKPKNYRDLQDKPSLIDKSAYITT